MGKQSAMKTERVPEADLDWGTVRRNLSEEAMFQTRSDASFEQEGISVKH